MLVLYEQIFKAYASFKTLTLLIEKYSELVYSDYNPSHTAARHLLGQKYLALCKAGAGSPWHLLALSCVGVISPLGLLVLSHCGRGC